MIQSFLYCLSSPSTDCTASQVHPPVEIKSAKNHFATKRFAAAATATATATTTATATATTTTTNNNNNNNNNKYN